MPLPLPNSRHAPENILEETGEDEGAEPATAYLPHAPVATTSGAGLGPPIEREPSDRFLLRDPPSVTSLLLLQQPPWAKGRITSLLVCEALERRIYLTIIKDVGVALVVGCVYLGAGWLGVLLAHRCRNCFEQLLQGCFSRRCQYQRMQRGCRPSPTHPSSRTRRRYMCPGRTSHMTASRPTSSCESVVRLTCAAALQPVRDSHCPAVGACLN